MGRGFALLDTGIHKSLLAAAQFVETIETRQGYKIACLKEIVSDQGRLSTARLQAIGQPLAKTGYGEYPLNLPKN